MAEPAVCRGAVPVLDVRGNLHHVAGAQALGGLALFLVPAFAIHADEHLPAALARMVDVPVVAAARLEGHVEDGQVVVGVGERVEIALPDEVLRETVVGLAQAEEPTVGLGAVAFRVAFGIHLLRHVECRPCVGPAGVEGDMGENLGHLLLRDAVLLGAGQVIFQRAVDDAFPDEGAYGDDAA